MPSSYRLVVVYIFYFKGECRSFSSWQLRRGEDWVAGIVVQLVVKTTTLNRWKNR